MGSARTEHDVVGMLLDPPELGDTSHVDEQPGLCEAQIQHRTQGLTAREHLCVYVGAFQVANCGAIVAMRFYALR